MSQILSTQVIERSNLDDSGLSYLIDREIELMSSLDHPHIVHLNEVYREEDTVCFVMELAKGGEVRNFTQPFVHFESRTKIGREHSKTQANMRDLRTIVWHAGLKYCPGSE